MQGENQRSLPTMLLVAGAFLAVYYAATYFFGSPDQPTPEGAETAELSDEQRAQQAAMARLDTDERRASQVTGTITTGDMIATIDNLGGGLVHVELLADRYRQAEARLDLVSTWREAFRPLRIDLPGGGLPVDAIWDLEQVSPTEVRLRWRGRGLEVVRSFVAGEGPYQIWQTVRVRNVGSGQRDLRLRVSTWHYVTREAEGGGGFLGIGNRSPAISQGLCRYDDETERKDRDALEERHGYRGAIDFVAIENTYFVQAIAPHGTQAEVCGLQSTPLPNADDPEGSLFEATLLYPSVQLAPGAEQVWQTLAYVGPKSPGALAAAGHDLPEVVNLGMFATIARGFASLLSWIQGHVGNWGLAIIILTILVRIALFPLMDRSFRSMAQMRRLKPEMDEINARFPNDPEKKQAAILELYRKHGINPMAQLGGCLPMLLQMPVFFALYASLSTNIELYHQPFALWWQDLSAPDPFFVLPLALGALMWLQQKLTPTSMDPAQARVMQFMPVIVTLFMLFLPAGLCLYMLTNSVLGIGQQKLNEWRYNRQQAAVALAGTTPGDPSAPSGDARPGANEGDKGTGSASASKRGSGRSRRG